MRNRKERPPRLAASTSEVTSGLERFSVQHGELTLTSVFQPIFSLSHMRAVGYEGLLRAHDMLDRPVSPLDVFGEAARVGDVLQLDRLAQTRIWKTSRCSAPNASGSFSTCIPAR